ncbi:MAG TPA: hypothetical protein PK954_25750, partial [Anaerolineales bacterium]|nr:hypothetical protein [Anaerolineales bacterium]
LDADGRATGGVLELGLDRAAGLELALWDLFAQRAGQSLRDHWGGTAERVKVGVSVGIQESPERLLEVVEGYLADGYRRVKLKIKPGRDVSE